MYINVHANDGGKLHGEVQLMFADINRRIYVKNDDGGGVITSAYFKRTLSHPPVTLRFFIPIT